MRRTSESLFISAVLNNPDDPRAYARYGVRPEHFTGYREEFEWVISYLDRVGELPTEDEIKTRFSGFNHSTTQTQMSYQATDILENSAKRDLKRMIADSVQELEHGHVSEAYALLGVTAPTTSAPPVSLLDDDSLFDDYLRDRKTLSVPWDALQGYTDGIGAGELWYLAARPAQGKSYALLAIAADAVLAGKKVIIYSLEMTREQVALRMHVILAKRLGIPGVTHTALRRRRMDIHAYKHLVRQIRESVQGGFWVITPAEARVTPALIASKADDYDLSLVDYIGLMHTNDGKASIEDWRIAAQISNELRRVSLSKKARIIAAAQVSREGDKRWGQLPPKLSNLSQTDALGQDGDVVITMNRYSKSILAMSLQKNRHGDSFTNWFSTFDPETGDFSQTTRARADEALGREEVELYE